jgi:nucleotide-binding universal stress UspA family protein
MKESHLNRVLVPCDFKEESKIALNHALQLASRTNAHVILLHITSDIKEAMSDGNRMDEWISYAKTKYQGEISSIVEHRELIEGIGEIASRESCELIVMATHGMRGWQHVTGSLALRVISESKVPCIVVQQREMRERGYQKIVIPIQWRTQILEEIPVIIQLAKRFSSDVFLLGLKDDVSSAYLDLMEKVHEQFESEGIKVATVIEEGGGNVAHKVTRYAASVEADLICSINFSYEYLYTLFPRAEEEDLIYNDAQIPVMLLTPEIQVNQAYEVPLWH